MFYVASVFTTSGSSATICKLNVLTVVRHCGESASALWLIYLNIRSSQLSFISCPGPDLSLSVCVYACVYVRVWLYSSGGEGVDSFCS